VNAADDRCDPPAFHDFLTCAAEAVLAGEAGDTVRQEMALFAARLAEPGVFPPGSPGAEALRVILDAAALVTEAAE
jgi:hypothetical protein